MKNILKKTFILIIFSYLINANGLALSKNQTQTDNKNTIPDIYAHTLIVPNSKIYFVQSDSVSTELVANDIDFIKNNQLIKNYYFNDKTKNFEYYDSKKNKLYIRVDKKLRLDIKRQTLKLNIFNEKKKQIYSNLIREYISATKQFASNKDYISFVNENNFNFQIVEKVALDNEDIEIANKDEKLSDMHVKNLIAPSSELFFYIKSRPATNTMKILKSYEFIKDGKLVKNYSFNKKTKLFEYRTDNETYVRISKRQSKVYLKATSQVRFRKAQQYNELIREFNLNTELFKDKKDYLAYVSQFEIKDNQIVEVEPSQKLKKIEVAKVEEPKQEEFKPKTSDIDKIAPIIEIAQNITVNKPDYEIVGKVSDTSDKIFIEIDGITSEVLDGKFKIKRYSPIDQNIKIVAIDQYGNRSKEKIISVKVDIKNTKVVNLEPLNPLKIKSKPNSSSVALIIGIEKYENTPAAKYASLDAKYFTEYSKNIFGVSNNNIKLLTDEQANLSNTNSAIFKWLPSKIKENQTDLIIFYSGHGLASADGKSKYILPSNVDPDLLSRTALSRNEFFDQIISLKPKSVTIFFDTCYSGVSRDEEMLLASAKPLMIVAEDENKLPENFTIFTASKPDQISSGLKEAKHGIFSYYLMKGLEGNADTNKDLKITNGELLAYMNKNISEKALDLGRKQNPLLFGNETNVIVNLN